MKLKKIKKIWRVLLLSFVLAFSISTCTSATAQIERTEILWDTWGIPHIFAKDNKDVFKAFGWAQMQSHGDLILRLYGEARGRAAEYWGEASLDSDKQIRTFGIPTLARQWYEAQKPEIRSYLDAFATGMNDYAKANPDRLNSDVIAVLPVTGTDILAHTLRVIHFTFMPLAGRSQQTVTQWQLVGSNAWAIAPSHSADNHAMLLANPHLFWSGLFRLYEAQLTSPDLDAYGATLVGLPLLTFAFNNNLGWTHTVNTIDTVDVYELNLTSDDTYQWDNGTKRLETETQTLKVKQENGTFNTLPLTIKRSIHGPIVAQKQNRALAMRVAGIDQPGIFEQYWDMARAQNLTEFETILKRLQIPMFTVLYADRDGHILHLFNGRVPVREGNYNWNGIVPGNTSATLWTKTHPYEDLPRVLDPESGWLQNANDPPWTTTFPPALNPSDYPPYMAPKFMHLRAQRSAKMLAADDRISFEELIAYKHSTEMELANRVLEDLINAANKSDRPLAKRAASTLSGWDRKADADSRGAVLFAAWAQAMKFPSAFATPWNANSPLTTPSGLANPDAAVTVLEQVATLMETRYGTLDVAWGDVFRLQAEGVDLPASGGYGDLGIFRVLEFTPSADRKFKANFGDTFVAAVEFSQPVRAQAILGYGNASQPGSPHRTDQFKLMGQLREVWRDRTSIEAHLESRQAF